MLPLSEYWCSPLSLEMYLKTKKIRDKEKALAAKKAQRTKVLESYTFQCSSNTLYCISYYTREARDMYANLGNEIVIQATIRVHFPDGFVVEATFKSTETISDIMELVRKSITRHDLAFYLCTYLKLLHFFEDRIAIQYPNLTGELRS